MIIYEVIKLLLAIVNVNSNMNKIQVPDSEVQSYKDNLIENSNYRTGLSLKNNKGMTGIPYHSSGVFVR